MMDILFVVMAWSFVILVFLSVISIVLFFVVYGIKSITGRKKNDPFAEISDSTLAKYSYWSSNS
ncbi:MAG: hypothetical protein LBQ31_10970 [Bacteroidales bacterium]|nr:hypothetical protein [Bacteroidales bacterium]